MPQRAQIASHTGTHCAGITFSDLISGMLFIFSDLRASNAAWSSGMTVSRIPSARFLISRTVLFGYLDLGLSHLGLDFGYLDLGYLDLPLRSLELSLLEQVEPDALQELRLRHEIIVG